MLYWLAMMIIMVIISNNDKLQIVSASSIRRLIQTMIWLSVSQLYLTLLPRLVERLSKPITGASAAPLIHHIGQQRHPHLLPTSLLSHFQVHQMDLERLLQQYSNHLPAALDSQQQHRSTSSH